MHLVKWSRYQDLMLWKLVWEGLKRAFYMEKFDKYIPNYNACTYLKSKRNRQKIGETLQSIVGKFWSITDSNPAKRWRPAKRLHIQSPSLVAKFSVQGGRKIMPNQYCQGTVLWRDCELTLQTTMVSTIQYCQEFIIYQEMIVVT